MDITRENCGRRTSLREFEKDLLREGILRLKPLNKKYIKDLELGEFIYKLLSDYNNRIITVFTNTEELQTDIKKRRSAGDIFRICKHYYPKCTLEGVLTALDEMSGDDGVTSSICYQIHKRTYRHSSDANGSIHNRSIRDEFNRVPGDYINNEVTLEDNDEEDEDN